MRKILIGSTGLLVVLIAGVAIAPQLVPSSVYKDKIQATLSEELARDVTISGDVKLAIFPSIKAQTGRVDIANPDGFGTESFASMDGLDAKVKLWPLFSKKVEIKSFTLKNPTINLEKNAAGDPNWAFGAKDEQAEPETPEGPFKRDGRYASLDPAIGLFSIENGTITYADKTKPGANYDLTDVNVAFSLPSLSKPVKIDGDLVFNTDPMDIDLTLDSPRAFLDGKAAPISIDFKAPYANINAKGEFTQSEDIAFNLNIDGDVSDVAALVKRLPMEVPYSDLAKAVTLKGNYSYDGKTLRAEKADINASGDLFTANYTGGGVLSNPPSLNGNIKANVKDLPALTKALGQDIKGIGLVKTFDMSAALTSAGKGFDAKDIDVNLGSDDLQAAFKGTGSYSDSLTANGNFTANAGSIPDIVKALSLDLPAAAALGDLDAKGTLALAGDTVTVNMETVKTDGPYLGGSFSGIIKKAGDAISANGDFKSNVNSLAETLDIAGFDIKPAKAVGKITASGKLGYDGKATSVKGLNVTTQDGTVTGTFTGDVAMADVLSVDGKFDTTLASLAQFQSVTGMELPYANSIGKVAASGTVKGRDKAFDISGLTAALSDGQINGDFTGAASMKDSFTIDGKLNADIPSLRAVASEGGTALPPSTDAGKIFERFNISGDVSGNPSDISFKNASIIMDDMKGQGAFDVDLRPAKPFVKGVLNMEGLDLRPYMASYAAQNPTGKIQPWSTDPINAAPLKAVEGDFKFTTPNIKTDRITLNQSNIDAKLRGGVMTAVLPNMSLYGGKGTMTGTVDASGSVPSIAMKGTLNDLASDSFLSAVAGFTQASGETATGFNFTGRGASIDDIMKSLDGDGNFNLVNGQIAGVDLAEFMTGLDTALKSRALPSGLGPKYATKFKDIIGLFTIENGVAKIGKFSLDGAGLLAEGQGQIDLGGQNIDFSLRPRLTGKSASDLASFGIPIRVSGGFGSAKVSLDTDMLAKIAAARAKAELTNVITDNVGGTAGEVLGGILGGGSGNGSTETQRPEDAVKDVLGGLLGGNKAPTEPAPEVTPSETAPEATPETVEEPGAKKTDEEKVEDALRGLFGGKKKKGE